MHGGEKDDPRGHALRYGLCVPRCAQLVTDDDARVHAAQCHGNALGLGAAGVDVAAYPRGAWQAAALAGHQFPALVDDADDGLPFAELLHKRSQQCGFAAARRAGQQQTAGGRGYVGFQLRWQRAGQPAGNAQVERRHRRETARSAAPSHADAAAALHSEIPSFQLVLIGVDRAAAELQKAVTQSLGIQYGGQPGTWQKLRRRT